MASRGRLATSLGILLPFIILFVLRSFTSQLPLAAAVLLKLYPVAINLALLASFSFSLWRGPSMIERLARLREPQLSPRAIAYTRQVTKVWCLFFLGNGSIALYCAFYLSDAAWALYNGVIAYALMALLFGAEWLYRQRMKRLDVA